MRRANSRWYVGLGSRGQLDGPDGVVGHLGLRGVGRLQQRVLKLCEAVRRVAIALELA